MPTVRHISLLLVLLAQDLCAQQGANEGTRPVEIFTGNGPRFSVSADSLDFADFQERNMSNGGSYSVPFRSRGYRMMWHMHQEDDRCTITRGDGRTLKEFQQDPPTGYSATREKPMAYGSRCVVVVITQPRRSIQQDRWYFEAP